MASLSRSFFALLVALLGLQACCAARSLIVGSSVTSGVEAVADAQDVVLLMADLEDFQADPSSATEQPSSVTSEASPSHRLRGSFSLPSRASFRNLARHVSSTATHLADDVTNAFHHLHGSEDFSGSEDISVEASPNPTSFAKDFLARVRGLLS